MPQKSDSNADPERNDLYRRVAAGVKEEPIPAKIVELAEKLENVLATRRKPAPKLPSAE
jgi:hypothetical protein